MAPVRDSGGDGSGCADARRRTGAGCPADRMRRNGGCAAEPRLGQARHVACCHDRSGPSCTDPRRERPAFRCRRDVPVVMSNEAPPAAAATRTGRVRVASMVHILGRVHEHCPILSMRSRNASTGTRRRREVRHASAMAARFCASCARGMPAIASCARAPSPARAISRSCAAGLRAVRARDRACAPARGRA